MARPAPPPADADYWYDRPSADRDHRSDEPYPERRDRRGYDDRGVADEGYQYPPPRRPDADRGYRGRPEDGRGYPDDYRGSPEPPRPRYRRDDERYDRPDYYRGGYPDDGYDGYGYPPGGYPPDPRSRGDGYPSDRPASRRMYRDQPYLDQQYDELRAQDWRDNPYGYPPPPVGTQLEPVPQRPPVPRGSHLPPYQEPMTATPAIAPDTGATGSRAPRKLTVTRVAALRSRELTNKGVQMFHRAATADGADRSGLTHLTYAVMANYAVDAAVAVALANTLFFAAATGQSTSKVLLYLLITVAPFAVIAPFIGPLLDKLQNGRRLALAASTFARAALALIMAFQFDTWVLYPCALGMLVLSKSFGVLKAALTPRVLPDESTLVKTNSRLTVFGLVAGGVAGAFAALLAAMTGSPGALIFTAAVGVAGGVLCLRIPAWVESTEGEVPVQETGEFPRAAARRSFPVSVSSTLWANATIRIETGFLALFIAFVVKSEYPTATGFQQLLLLGIVGVAAGTGGFLGNALGARMPLTKPEVTSIVALAAVLVSTLIAVLAPGLATAAVVGLIGSTASSLAKVCLDSVMQRELPEASRASAFGLSETALQLSWVFGGVIGLLIGGVWSFGHSAVYSIGFGVVTVLLVLGLVQCLLVRRGATMVPKFGRRRRRSAAAARSATPPQSGQPPQPGRAAPAGEPPGPAQPPSAPPPRPATAAAPIKRRTRRAGDPR